MATSRLNEYWRKKYATWAEAISSSIIEPDKPTKDQEVDVSDAYQGSRSLLGEYVTLDWPHREEIIKLKRTIRAYALDRSRRRPLNVIMRAEPGSGKSHFVRCLAKNLAAFSARAIDFNMANLQGIEDLAVPLDSVRNQKVQDRLPILFLDEFDSDPNKYPILLPLLWDGELHIAHRSLNVGKLVIILAGSSPRIGTAMKEGKSMHEATVAQDDKLPDLLSRINGGELDIPSLELVTRERDRRVDKVCLSIALLHHRFGEDLELVPWNLIKFIVANKFRYGVRSMTHLIDLLPPIDDEEEVPTLRVDTLPLSSVDRLKKSSLAYHLLSEDGPAAVIDQWKVLLDVKVQVRVIAKEEEDEIPD